MPDEEEATHKTRQRLRQKVSSSSKVQDFRLTSKSKLARGVKPGDLLMLVHREDRKNKVPESVYRPAPVLFREKQDKTHDYVFYEEYADSEDTALSWAEFKRLAKRLGLSGWRSICVRSERVLSGRDSAALLEMWGR